MNALNFYFNQQQKGHQDYFPNGGKSQTGCGISIDFFNMGFGKRKRSISESFNYFKSKILGIDPGKFN